MRTTPQTPSSSKWRLCSPEKTPGHSWGTINWRLTLSSLRSRQVRLLYNQPLSSTRTMGQWWAFTSRLLKAVCSNATSLGSLNRCACRPPMVILRKDRCAKLQRWRLIPWAHVSQCWAISLIAQHKDPLLNSWPKHANPTRTWNRQRHLRPTCTAPTSSLLIQIRPGLTL